MFRSTINFDILYSLMLGKMCSSALSVCYVFGENVWAVLVEATQIWLRSRTVCLANTRDRTRHLVLECQSSVNRAKCCIQLHLPLYDVCCLLDTPTMKFTIPKQLTGGASEQELGGLIGRIIASQMSENKDKGNNAYSGFFRTHIFGHFHAYFEQMISKDTVAALPKTQSKICILEDLPTKTFCLWEECQQWSLQDDSLISYWVENVPREVPGCWHLHLWFPHCIVEYAYLKDQMWHNKTQNDKQPSVTL